MTKDEALLRKRLTDLSKQAFTKNIVTYSDFLNLNELNILHTTPKDELMTGYETFGGYESAERQMAAFLPDALYYDYRYPVRVLEITALNPRFAENLTHRDYLGSLMNLGIERNRLGDILVEEGRALLFAEEEIASYIAENLTQVKHTQVQAAVRDLEDIRYEPRYQEIKGNVPSLRLDAVISTAFPMSRSKMTPYIEGGKVFVNGKLITSNGYQLKDGDLISVRGLGKIRYAGLLSKTKKGRCVVSIQKFI